MEFTKGKWVINKTGYQILDEDKEPLCDIWNFNKSREECQANAKLIACAPEMFEFLIEAQRIYKEKGTLLSVNAGRIEQLIKKATE